MWRPDEYNLRHRCSRERRTASPGTARHGETHSDVRWRTLLGRILSIKHEFELGRDQYVLAHTVVQYEKHAGTRKPSVEQLDPGQWHRLHGRIITIKHVLDVMIWKSSSDAGGYIVPGTLHRPRHPLFSASSSACHARKRA